MEINSWKLLGQLILAASLGALLIVATGGGQGPFGAIGGLLLLGGSLGMLVLIGLMLLGVVD